MTSTQLQYSPQTGDIAPEFTAASTSGTELSLASFRGKSNVLLAFFPLAFTGTCTKELICDFKRDISRGYGVLNEDRFYSNRAYFLIDRAGRVSWSHVESNNGQRREDSEILAEIAKLNNN